MVKLRRLPHSLSKYAVSRDGRVWSSHYYGPWSGDGKLWHPLQGQLTNSGYLNVTLHLEGTPARAKANFSVHGLIAEAFIGPRPEGMQINHKDGVKTHNDYLNLEYVTATQNVQHAHDTGLITKKTGPSSEKSRTAKLTWAIVHSIRAIEDPDIVELAKQYGVSKDTIKDVIQGKTWRHI